VAAALIGTDIPLGVVPNGTYNNFARSLNLPLDPLAACEVITGGQARPIDVGMANERPFFECLGAGLDAALYPLGEEIKSGSFRRWIDLFRRAYRFRPQKFSLILDRPLARAISSGSANESRHLLRRLAGNQKSEITLSALMLTVSNGPYFGMNFAVAPDQRMDDGLLTVTIFSRYSKLQLWWHFLSIAFGRREYDPKSITLRVERLRISGPRPLPVHLDGSPQKNLWPVDAACRPAALQVFRPPA
jgi:diacylglycerol kinase family enzyme